MNIQSKIDHSIKLLKKAESLALMMQPETGYYLAFSGGKDSQCIYHLAKMAGVKFHAVYNVTTLDPPPLVYFIRDYYKDVEFDCPKRNFWQICEDKGILPTMRIRFCCQELKETRGVGYVTIIGIRHEESTRRAGRTEFEKVHKDKKKKVFGSMQKIEEMSHQCVLGKDKFVVCPIIEWTEEEVWYFLNEVVKVPHCELYDKGWKRIGCLFCPMSSKKCMKRDKETFPKYYEKMIKTIHAIRKKGYMHDFPDMTDEQVWGWYASKKSIRQWRAENIEQQKLKFE